MGAEALRLRGCVSGLRPHSRASGPSGAPSICLLSWFSAPSPSPLSLTTGTTSPGGAAWSLEHRLH